MDVTQGDLENLAERLGKELMRLGWYVTAAESCTGGWAAQAMTAIAGSSAWFDRGFVTYSNEAKMEMLGVSEQALTEYGAVSEATVSAMALGAIKHSRAKAAFAISGIAGPGGGSDSKPVGTVCFGWYVNGEPQIVERKHLPGNRTQVRAQAVAYALQRMQALLVAVQ